MKSMIRELDRNLIVLRFNRIWAEDENSKTVTLLLRLISAAGMFISASGMVIEGYLARENLVTVTYCISLSGATGPSFAKFYCLMRWSPLLKNILKELKSGLASKYNINEQEKKYVEDAEKIIKITLRIYLTCCLTACSNTILIPIWKKAVTVLGWVPEGPMGTPIPTWAPFDVHEFYTYIFVFILQAYHLYSITAIWIGLDALFGGIILHLSAHLKIISDRMNTWVSSQKFDKKKTIQDKEDFAKIVLYHTEVLKLCQDLNEAVNLGHLVEVLMIGLSVCSCGIQVMNSPKEEITRALIMLFLLACIGGSWWVVCYFGSMIVTECQNLGRSVYFTEWIHLSGKERKNILFVMSRCRKPVYMTTGKFFKVSLPTFLDTAKMSYSLLAILRNVYD